MPIAERFPLPDKGTVYNSMEGLIQHFELIMTNRGFEAHVVVGGISFYGNCVGIPTVAVYSDADSDAAHVAAADPSESFVAACSEPSPVVCSSSFRW